MDDDGFEVKDESLTDPANIQASREAISMLAGLDEIYRTVITMRFIEEMSPGEIAAALGITENAVSVRIHRAIELLKKIADKSPEIRTP